MGFAETQIHPQYWQAMIADPQIADWEDLRYLLAIGREGTLAGAARRLGVNHSTVFRRLQQAEARLGLRVFERLPTGYLPTAAGETVLEEAARMDEAANALARRAAGSDVRLTGRIRLTTAPNLAADYVAGYLPEFLARYPDIRIEIAVGDRDYDLARREADLALRATPQPPDYLVGRKVRELAWWVCAGEAYLRTHPAPAAMDDLAKHALIGAEASFLRVAPFAWLERNFADERFVARANDLNTMAALTVAGVGLSLLPSDQSRAGLVRLFPLQPAFPAALWLLTHPDLRGVARIRAFSDFLSARLRDEPRLA
jgi:DNA-binding transcriptional LysR family regulator